MQEIETNRPGQYFSEAHSVDGMFFWQSASPGYVGISCEETGLTDNTRGQAGWHIVYLQTANNDAELTPELIAGARSFKSAISQLQQEREDEARIADFEASEREIRERGPVPKFPYRSSEEAWEAEDEEMWARMQRHEL